MQENGTEQPKVYRHTRTMLKIRSTPTEVEWTEHMMEWTTESRRSESNIPAIPNMVRDSVHENFQENVSPDPLQSTLTRLDLPPAAFDSADREEIADSLCTDETALSVQMKLHWRYLKQMDKIHCIHQGLASQQERTLESQPAHLVIFTCKVTIAPGSVEYHLKMLSFKLYIYIKGRLVQNMTHLQYFTITIIDIDYC